MLTWKCRPVKSNYTYGNANGVSIAPFFSGRHTPCLKKWLSWQLLWRFLGPEKHVFVSYYSSSYLSPVPVFVGWGFLFLSTSFFFKHLMEFLATLVGILSRVPKAVSVSDKAISLLPSVRHHLPLLTNSPSHATLVLHTMKLLIWPVSKSHLCLLLALWLWNFLNFSEPPFSHYKMGLLWCLLHRWGLREIMHIKHLKSANLACSMI